MKEVTYEKWIKNPTPREMWVWDADETKAVKKMVLYLFPEDKFNCNVIVLVSPDSNTCDTYCHCAEIEEPETKTHRMTHKELSRWLREKPTREWTFIFQKPARVHTVFEYFDNEANQPVDEDILIRENGGEWHEPLVEVEE